VGNISVGHRGPTLLDSDFRRSDEQGYFPTFSEAVNFGTFID